MPAQPDPKRYEPVKLPGDSEEIMRALLQVKLDEAAAASPSDGFPFDVSDSTYARGTVKFFNDDKGWGGITASELPHDIWVHFSSIDVLGYGSLEVGQPVEFRYVDCWSHQDSWHYRTTWVRPLPDS